jgi:hypothetical protein
MKTVVKSIYKIDFIFFFQNAATITEGDKKAYLHHLTDLRTLHYFNDNLQSHLLFMGLLTDFINEMQEMKQSLQ